MGRIQSSWDDGKQPTHSSNHHTYEQTQLTVKRHNIVRIVSEAPDCKELDTTNSRVKRLWSTHTAYCASRGEMSCNWKHHTDGKQVTEHQVRLNETRVGNMPNLTFLLGTRTQLKHKEKELLAQRHGSGYFSRAKRKIQPSRGPKLFGLWDHSISYTEQQSWFLKTYTLLLHSSL